MQRLCDQTQREGNNNSKHNRTEGSSTTSVRIADERRKLDEEGGWQDDEKATNVYEQAGEAIPSLRRQMPHRRLFRIAGALRSSSNRDSGPPPPLPWVPRWRTGFSAVPLPPTPHFLSSVTLSPRTQRFYPTRKPLAQADDATDALSNTQLVETVGFPSVRRQPSVRNRTSDAGRIRRHSTARGESEAADEIRSVGSADAIVSVLRRVFLLGLILVSNSPDDVSRLFEGEGECFSLLRRLRPRAINRRKGRKLGIYFGPAVLWAPRQMAALENAGLLFPLGRLRCGPIDGGTFAMG